MRNNGFTVLEVVVVLVVISILGLSINFSPQTGALSLKAETQSLVSQLRRAQFHAISGNKRTRVSFLSTSYSLFDLTYSAPIIDLRTGQNSIALPAGYSLSITSLPNNYIVFDSQGTPYFDETTGALAQAAIITMTHEGAQFQIEIRPRTGKIKLL